VFIPVNMLTGASDKALITANQFQIRFNEHRSTADALVQAIVEGAGYSAQTFGEAPTSGGAITATEVEDRNRRTILSRGKKMIYWRQGVKDILYGLMSVDAVVFGRHGLQPARPDVTFPDAVLPSPQELAQTAVALSTAHAASVQTLVQLVHPDWDQDKVDEEVELIRAEEADEVLGRARISLTAPQGSTETIGQQVQELESTIPVTPGPGGGDPAETGGALPV